jgi:hypothetical protein
MTRGRILLLCVLTIGLLTGSADGQLQKYDSPYYVIHTDLTGDDVREASLRMTRMAEEYHARTKDFSGVISQRLPFMLFKNRRDYAAAGGPPGSAGVFNGTTLMAVAGEETSNGTWHVVQHEGFHQFAHAVIRGQIPIWANEGLAEYFGESIFTGDGFVTGLIPPSRLARIKKTMDANGFMSIPDMMRLSHAEWNGRLKIANYDQAWSMVHFLAHGEDGKYQKAFSGFMIDIGRGVPWTKAWQNNFGDAVGFEAKWKAYWQNLPERPTTGLYLHASVAALTSYLARATASKQTFDGFPDFLAAVKGNAIKIEDADWLPQSLAKEFGAVAEKRGEWSITKGKGPLPILVMVDEDDMRYVGTFAVRGKRVDRVRVDLDDLKPTLAKADAMYKDGKKDAARKLVQDSLRRNPNSPMVADARKFLAENK